MGKVLHSKSTLTDRYQTTIPGPIREALHLDKHDKIEYTLESNGKVTISRVDEDDPTLGCFLTFLANDIKTHPEHIKPMSSELFNRATSLVADIDVDLDTPLSDKDE